MILQGISNNSSQGPEDVIIFISMMLHDGIQDARCMQLSVPCMLDSAASEQFFSPFGPYLLFIKLIC